MKTNRKRIYISGPLTSSGPLWGNVTVAVAAFRQLQEAGFAPLCPHLTAYIDPHGETPHVTWMETDLPWVEIAHAVLRLPGASLGADIETEFAAARNIPVFTSVQEISQFFHPVDDIVA